MGSLAVWVVEESSGTWWIPALLGSLGAVGMVLSLVVPHDRDDQAARPPVAHHGAG